MVNPKEGDQLSADNWRALVRADYRELLPPGFRQVISGEDAKKERLGLYQDRSISFSESLSRADRLQSSRIIDSTALVDLNEATRLMMLQSYVDPLEEYRAQLGLTERREELIEYLKSRLSFELGLEIFGEGTGHKYTSMMEVNSEFPHLTRTEMTLLGLVRQAPEAFRQQGLANSDQSIDNEQIHKYLVPVMMGASIDGLLFNDETIDPNRVYLRDVYTNLGITNASSYVETAPYQSEVRQTVEELVSLAVTNYRLYERLINTHSSRLMDGFGKLDRLALSRILEDDLSDRSLSEILNEISPEQRKRYLSEKQQLEEGIAKAVVVNLHKGETLSVKELVGLIGLLDRVPEVLTNVRVPFAGYFTPFGAGVMLVGEDGSGSFTAYHPYYLRDALQGIYYETVDVSNNNQTVVSIFNDLSRAAAEETDRFMAETGDDPSMLEGIQADMKLSLDVDLKIRPGVYLVAIDRDSAYSDARTDQIIEPVVKFGAREAQQVFETLKLLPRQLLEGVNGIRKIRQMSFPLEYLLMGQDRIATYNRTAREISLYFDPLHPYVTMTAEMRALLSFSLIHEVGHAVWNRMTGTEQNDWIGISWSGQEMLPTGFLTMYSRAEDPQEDFCEHLASFVLHGPEFREKAVRARVLDQKYKSIKRLITALSGKEIDYPAMSSFGIEEVVGSVHRQFRERDAAEIERAKRSADLSEEILARQVADSIQERLDEGSENEVIDASRIKRAYEKIDMEDKDFVLKTTQVDDRLRFESEVLNLLIDNLSSDLYAEDAVEAAHDVYSLIEEGRVGEAVRECAKYIEDDDDLETLADEIGRIAQVIKSGRYPEPGFGLW